MRTKIAAPALSVAEHIRLGNALKDANHAVITAIAHFNKSSQEYRAAKNASERLSKLRGLLNCEVQRIVPRERDPRSLFLHVYYNQKLVPERPSENPQDFFDGWRPER